MILLCIEMHNFQECNHICTSKDQENNYILSSNLLENRKETIVFGNADCTSKTMWEHVVSFWN